MCRQQIAASYARALQSNDKESQTKIKIIRNLKIWNNLPSYIRQLDAAAWKATA